MNTSTLNRLIHAARKLDMTCKWVPQDNPCYAHVTPEMQRQLWYDLREATRSFVPPTPREHVYQVIDKERAYQDAQYPENEAHPKLPPSDELRLIQTIINQAHEQWYKTRDRVIDGIKVNPSDLHMLRKIAACAIRCLEHFGAPDRPEWVKVANPPPKV